MFDSLDLIKNVERVYDSDTSFQFLKDFERVLEELGLYVFPNWIEGELLEGPNIERHWVTCKFMWPRDQMPDPMGGKRLLEYDCKIKYIKSTIIEPRKIKKPSDMRPDGSNKGKLDEKPVWVVEVQMPRRLITYIYNGYQRHLDDFTDPLMPNSNDLDQAEPEGEDDLGTESADNTGGDESLEDDYNDLDVEGST